MAIKVNGGENPTEIKYVKGGVVTNLTEVWYKSSPNATAVKVWPEGPKDTWKFNFSKNALSGGSYVANTSLIPLSAPIELKAGQALTTKAAYNAVGYPKSTTLATYTVSFDGAGVKTYASKTATKKQTDSCVINGWNLYSTESGSGSYISNTGKIILVNPNTAWTCPGNLQPDVDTCWWRPSFKRSANTSTSSVTLPSKETVNHKILSGWKTGTTTYNPGASITPSSDMTLTAVWEDQPTYALSWGSIPSGIKLTVNGTAHTSGSGSATLYKNDYGYATYTFTGDGQTLWKVYNDGVYVNSFTGNYTVSTEVDKARGTIAFNSSTNTITITEYNY